MVLSTRIGAFAGVVLFLSVLPAVYLLGEARGAHKVKGNTSTDPADARRFEPANYFDPANHFDPANRFEQQPQKLNPSQANPSGACKWQVAPTPQPGISMAPDISLNLGNDPFAQVQRDMRAMQAQMDALFGQVQTGFPIAIPNCGGDSFGQDDGSMEETDNEYVYHFNVPGAEKSSVKVNVDDDKISVSGTCVESISNTTSTSTFMRSSALLGPVDAASLKSEFKDGVLTVTIQKQHAAGQRSPGAQRSDTILN